MRRRPFSDRELQTLMAIMEKADGVAHMVQVVTLPTDVVSSLVLELIEQRKTIIGLRAGLTASKS